jgi:hypothetical protein
MTMMVSGDDGGARPRPPHSRPHRGPGLRARGPRRRRLDVQDRHNLLAAANLAAGAEALALAHAAGLDLEHVRDVVNASSGGSWIFADRIPRALQNDLSPRAAVKLLAKDVAIAAALADRLRVDAPFGKLARGAFSAAVAAGHAEDDDAVLMRLALGRAVGDRRR